LTKVCFVEKGSGKRLHAQEGQHGDHSHDAAWSAQSVSDKQRKGTAFIMETATELHFIGSLKDKAPVQDELSRRIFACVEDRKLYISAVFGIDLLHTIHRRLCDAGMSGKPVDTLLDFIKSSTTKMDSLSSALPPQERRSILEPIRRHMIDAQTDIFQRQKAACKRAGIETQTPFFTLRRHPVLCGLMLHAERVLVQKTALNLEQHLGGLTAAVHLGNALIREGHLSNLGALQVTRRLQGDRSFFLGGNAPTTRPGYLSAYGHAIGWSAANLAASTRGGTGLAARSTKLELAVHAPFSRAVADRL
jgi:hypothetical protein